MTARYFLDQAPDENRAVVRGSEAHHLLHVMRCGPGDEVQLFDGSGRQYEAKVTRVHRSEVECEIHSAAEVDRELPRPLVLAVALPKGDRQQWLTEKAVELGVTRLVPLVTARSVAQPTGSSRARLERAVIEASKQCGRNRLMEVAQGASINELLRSWPASAVRLLAHPGGESLRTARAALTGQHTEGSPLVVAIGPEGGFSGEEVAAAKQASWQLVDLGPRILRVETAALLLAAWAALLLTGDD